jgi:hypothetical protein
MTRLALSGSVIGYTLRENWGTRVDPSETPMGKTIIAFVAGLAVAALAFSLFNSEPANTSLEQARNTSLEQARGTPSREGVDESDPGTEGGSRDSIPNGPGTDTGSGEPEVQLRRSPE